MGYLFEVAQESAASVKGVAGEPVVGVILGSGFGPFAERLSKPVVVPYTRIPNFPPARVEGHAGELLFATLKGVRVAVLSGRIHYYEGHDLDTVTLPTRVLALLGVRALLVTNAAGGIRADLQPGDLMAVEDHINLMGANPLRGPKDPRLGPRFPDMTEAYAGAVRVALHEAAKSENIDLKDGVYAALGGPSYETPAEIKMLASVGADAVGMSTVPEVIVANQMGLAVGAISCIANRAAGLSGTRLSHADVTHVAEGAAERFCRLLAAAIPVVANAVCGGPAPSPTGPASKSLGAKMKPARRKKR